MYKRQGLHRALRGPEGFGCARVHQRVGGAWQKAVVDEKIFFDVQRAVTPVSYTHLDVYKRQLDYRAGRMGGLVVADW